jgi:hypothetical protein
MKDGNFEQKDDGISALDAMDTILAEADKIAGQ